VPTTALGKVVGSVEMVIGVSFIAFLTAGVTSTVIQRGEAEADEAERTLRDRSNETIVGALTQIQGAIADLDRRLDQIESEITG
jgi:prefoldin subunit 5